MSEIVLNLFVESYFGAEGVPEHKYTHNACMCNLNIQDALATLRPRMTAGTPMMIICVQLFINLWNRLKITNN